MGSHADSLRLPLAKNKKMELEMSENNPAAPLLNPAMLLLLILVSTALFAYAGAISMQNTVILICAECCFMAVMIIAELVDGPDSN